MRGILCPSVIGRGDELDEIGEALAGAADSSRGTMLFVLGEAGIGKSRLAQEAIAQAREAHFSVLSGRATLPHSTVAYRPLTEALFSYFRDQGPPDVPELEPFRGALSRLVPDWRRDDDGRAADDSIVLLAESLVRLLRAVGRKSGCLLVLDDLHWADPETLSIVEYLAENLVSEPVVCVCTVRSEEASTARSLAHVLSARRAASTITLSRLAPEDTTAMALACLATLELPDSVEALLSASADGLPFFVEELLAGAVGSGALSRGDAGWTVAGALEPDVPLTFLDTVDGRLRTMGEAAGVLVAAAVLGRRFEWTLLPDITGLSEQAVLSALRTGVDAQLLVAEPSSAGSFRFRHSLTRDAVIQRLLPVEWASLARRALVAIEAAHPGLPEEWCDLGARLAERAGERPQAAALWFESGRRSRSRGALTSAEDAFSRALDLAQDAPELAADAAEALCESLSLSGKVDQALELGDRLDAMLQALGAPAERVGRVHLWLARGAASVARWDVADDHAQQARAHAQEADALELTAPVDAVGAAVALARGDIDRAKELAETSRSVAERLGLHEVVCEALEVVGRAARRNDLSEAEVAFGKALLVAEQHDLEVWRVRALFELAGVDHLARLSTDRMESVRELAMANGALAVAAHVDLMLALSHVDRFELEKALVSARRAGEVARRFRMQSLHALTLLVEGATSGWRGQHHEMEARVEEALVLAGDEADIAGCAWMLVRGVSSLIVEHRERALGELDTGMEAVRQSAFNMPIPQRGVWALVRAVDDVDGEAACAEVRASGVVVHRMIRGFVHYAEAVLAGRKGDKEEAERLVAEGDADLAPAHWFQQLARRLMAEAAIADGWGDPVGWLREALVCFEGHGQEQLVTACRSLLSRAGAPVPRRRPDSRVPAALRQLGVTDREHEVLTLLADGLPNKEIAGRLYMSPRTVERHIANTAVKVGLRTRAELVAFAARNAG